ncbi:hypothetical protein DPMN_189170 [Dreissena polymorpha]|uniref:Uncharacterized protein n=1 Tax=Dreissena polymorpha TaxID=45954 RepID=A0A9D4IAL4_DREPO|nr:hypothetical protein DPMN_189170 [Dreissena polymorpha]
MKTNLPQFSLPPSRKRKYVKERDTKVKQKNKYYADKRNKAKASALRPGDKVLVKQQMRIKLVHRFRQFPEVVSRKLKGSMVTVRHKDRTLTRDASHFKPVLALPLSHDDLRTPGNSRPSTRTTTAQTFESSRKAAAKIRQ